MTQNPAISRTNNLMEQIAAEVRTTGCGAVKARPVLRNARVDVMDHSELCDIARKWLLRNHSSGGAGCQVALAEPSTVYGGESPDAIGWRLPGPYDGSYMIECKVTRSDFLADAKKPFRVDPETGVGSFRYFMCPEGLISIEEIPDMWGLLFVNSRGHVKPQRHFLHEIENFPRQGMDFTEWSVARQQIAEQYRHLANETHELRLMAAAISRVDDPMKVIYREREKAGIIRRLQADLDAEKRSRDNWMMKYFELMNQVEERNQGAASA